MTASVAGRPGVAKSAIGIFTARDERIDVTRVDVEPAFGDPGDSVDVSARIFNAVNPTVYEQRSNPVGKKGIRSQLGAVQGKRKGLLASPRLP